MQHLWSLFTNQEFPHLLANALCLSCAVPPRTELCVYHANCMFIYTKAHSECLSDRTTYNDGKGSNVIMEITVKVCEMFTETTFKYSYSCSAGCLSDRTTYNDGKGSNVIMEITVKWGKLTTIVRNKILRHCKVCYDSSSKGGWDSKWVDIHTSPFVLRALSLEGKKERIFNDATRVCKKSTEIEFKHSYSCNAFMKFMKHIKFVHKCPVDPTQEGGLYLTSITGLLLHQQQFFALKSKRVFNNKSTTRPNHALKNVGIAPELLAKKKNFATPILTPQTTLPNSSLLFLSTITTAFDNPIVQPLALSNLLNTSPGKDNFNYLRILLSGMHSGTLPAASSAFGKKMSEGTLNSLPVSIVKEETPVYL
ncbi:hypothetical protein EGR_10901 [Echinococcus granulosus]|uniref:Uncharacterized protein n=1 Tax=Echinococcus granulosus TaxID=6210 RepID=W6U179_ECHGR|nr:hypothetical protein EGR_10901 [Echinococcus granulosus]EUB54241.1 hypothetical protein EGR_10901 [Echinococcus granulosus]